MKVCLYKITSPSGRVYIGQAWNITRRFREYGYIERSKQQTKLNSSFRKYGIKSHMFEIIHELPSDVTQPVLDIYEQLYIDLYRSCNVDMMNLREAGSRGKHSDETKKKLSIIHTGKVLSSETRNKISKNRKGKGICTCNSMYGKGLTGEAKERMRSTKTGKEQTPEHKKAISEALRRAYAEGRR